MYLIDILALLMAGWMVGNELAVLLFIHPVMNQLDGLARTRGLSLFAAALGRAMPFWYALCLILFVIETVARRGQPSFSFLLAATILATIVLLVPINNRMAKLERDALPERWQPEHRRWERLHRIRILILGVAFFLVLHALLIARR